MHNWGRYRVVAPLSRGHRSDVVVAKAPDDVLVALKRLRASARWVDGAVHGLCGEAQALVAIQRHSPTPHVVAPIELFNMGTDDDVDPVLVEELVAGPSLAVLSRHAHQWDEATNAVVVESILLDIGLALHAVHATHVDGEWLQLAHGDVAARNMLLDAQGRWVLVDFDAATSPAWIERGVLPQRAPPHAHVTMRDDWAALCTLAERLATFETVRAEVAAWRQALPIRAGHAPPPARYTAQERRHRLQSLTLQ